MKPEEIRKGHSDFFGIKKNIFSGMAEGSVELMLFFKK